MRIAQNIYVLKLFSMNGKSNLTDENFSHAAKHDSANVQDARTCHITVFQSMRITLLLEKLQNILIFKIFSQAAQISPLESDCKKNCELVRCCF
jgi:hypothetical protein